MTVYMISQVVESYISIIKLKILVGKLGTNMFTIRGQKIYKGQAIGDIDDDLVKRFQIRQND